MKARLSRHVIHLARRTIESLRRTPVDDVALAWVRSQLVDREFDLWNRMQQIDRAHSIGVARRLLERDPGVERHEIAAALLHDVGKLRSSLSVWARIAATIVGPRTRRFREYHDHERIGAQMCHEVGIDSRVCDLVAGRGSHEEATRLRAADDL